MRNVAFVGLVFGLVACGSRAPGPHAEDEGKVTYWRVAEASTAESNGCTDAEDWAGVVNASPIEAGKYFMYRVESGGGTATSMDCSTLDASSCVESDSGLVFQISGSTLTYDAPGEEIVADANCSAYLWAVWTIVDGGETGDFALDMSFTWDGDCDAIEAAIVADSTNGLGLADCEISVAAPLELEQIE